MSAQPRLVVFDWDQTLWDSWELHCRCVDYAAHRLGVEPPPREAVRRTFLQGFDPGLEQLLGMGREVVLPHYLEFYHRAVAELGRPFPGVEQALERLRSRGFSLALLTNKPRFYGLLELDIARLGGAFDVLVFGDDPPSAKPSADGLRHILNATSCPPDSALVVGDHPWDVLCARGAGVRAAGALWGCLDREALLRAGPDTLWHRLEEGTALLCGGGL